MNNRTLDCLKDLPRNSILSTLSALSHQEQREIRRDSQEHRRVRMPSVDLTKVIFELPHRVTSPHHRHHNHRGGRRHHRLALHHHNHRLRPLKTLGFWNVPVLFPRWPAYQPMEPSDHDASARDRHCCPCAVHG
jgi:hypothetical protein